MAIERILNCERSRGQEAHAMMEGTAAEGFVKTTPDLPETVDLRAYWWDVGDQGTSGACVGWAVADGPLRWHLVQAGAIAPGDHLSARYLWMASKELDKWRDYATTFIEKEGTSLEQALDVLRVHGVVKEDVLPFFSGSLYPLDQKAFYRLAGQLKIASYRRLRLDVDRWKYWLANVGPIAVRIRVDRKFMNCGRDGRLDAFDRSTEQQEGHAATLVGYEDGRFIIRNSYGCGWGHNGFGYASYAYMKAAATEAFGILMQHPSA